MHSGSLRLGIMSVLLVCLGLAQTAASTGQKIRLQWFGQSALKLVSPHAKIILIDPFISKNPKTPEAHQDRMKLGRVDLILATHGHGDQMICFEKSGPMRPLGDGITVAMARAENSSAVMAKDGESGRETIQNGGEPAECIIRRENEYTLYHAGNTGVFGHMVFIGEYYEPDIALLPGGHFTMDPGHAAYAARQLLKTRLVVPMHYGTFPPLKGTPEQFSRSAGGLFG